MTGTGVPQPLTQTKFLGVPDTYAHTTPLLPRDNTRPDDRDVDAWAPNPDGTQFPISVSSPQYPTGSEMGILRMTTEDVARMQARMAIAGLIGPKTQIRVGVADNTTVSAYKTLLTFANRYGYNYDEALNQLASNPLTTAAGATTGKTTTTSTTPPTFTDPMDARATVRQAFQASEHRDPTEDEIKAFANQLHSSEEQTGGTTTSTYDPATRHTETTTTHQDTPDANTLADQMTRTGKLGRERNTNLVGIDYFNAMLAANGPVGGS